MAIRSDGGREFINESFVMYCMKKDIKHQLSVPRTLQQNPLVEIRNRSLVVGHSSLIKTILNDFGPRLSTPHVTSDPSDARPFSRTFLHFNKTTMMRYLVGFQT